MRKLFLSLSFCFVTAIVSSVSAGTLADYTSYITNPSFESDVATGWTNNGMWRQTNNVFTGKVGTYYLESWVPTTNQLGNCGVSQTLTLPAGNYQLKVNAQHINENSPNAAQSGVYLFAGTARQTVTTNNTYSLNFSVLEAGSVEIGLVGEGATGNYLCLDNFRLEYVSAVNADSYKTEIRNLISTGQALLDKGIQSSVSSTLTSAISAGNSALNSSNLTTLQNAYNNLVSAVAAAEASRALYDKLQARIDYADKVLGWWNGVAYRASAWSQLNTAVTTAKSQVTNYNLTDAQLNSAVTTLNTRISAVDKKIYCTGSACGSDSDLQNPNSWWSYERSLQSKHWILFWEPGFGTTAPAAVPGILEKADQLFEYYANTLGFLTINQGRSKTDTYKMIIRLEYSTNWKAEGLGVDNVVGMLTLSNGAHTSRSGQTVAHEVGHCFQYQVHCDNNNWNGWMYNWGSSTLNVFWEMCAQWQAYKFYPNMQFVWNSDQGNDWFGGTINGLHRHPLCVDLRYNNYFIQDFMCHKQGDLAFIGRLWNESQNPEDPFQAYMRLTMTGTATQKLAQFGDEMWEYGARMTTFDLDPIRSAGAWRIGFRDQTALTKDSENYYWPTAANCIENFGNNAIRINAPSTAKTIYVEFEGKAGASGYTSYNTQYAGWRIGFVAYKNDGTRYYSDITSANASSPKKTISFNCPAGCSYVWLVVSGAPTSYWTRDWLSWSEESTVEQWPYRVKFHQTNVYGQANNNTVPDNVEPEPEPDDVKETIMEDGWAKLDALPNDYSPYFFAIYDHDQSLGLVQKTGANQGSNNKAMWYQANVIPGQDKTALWTFDSNVDGSTEYVVMTCANYPDYMMQTEWNAAWNYRTNDNGAGDISWGRTLISYADSKWTIQNGHYPEAGYLGAWDNIVLDNAETALNKTGDNVGYFDIFSMLRGQYVAKYEDLSTVSTDAPLNISYVLENPGGERRSSIGWKTEGTGWQAQGSTALTGKVGGFFLERWVGSGLGESQIYQEIQGLPDGLYKFSAIAHCTSNCYLYANDVQVAMPTNNPGTRTSVLVEVTNGTTLRVGARSASNAGAWIAFDDARLEFLGEPSEYNVGEAEVDLTNFAYFKNPSAVTLTYSYASTTDESAVFALINSGAKLTLKQNGITQAQGTLSLSDKVLTATFSGVTLAAATTYTLELPAGVVGYAGHASNNALSTEFTTPQVFTGTYYLYNHTTDDFLDRSGNDVYATFLGTPITWANGTNGATIEFQSSNTFLGGRWWSTSNNADGIRWKAIAVGDGQYKIQRTQPEDIDWDYLYVGTNQRIASNGKCTADGGDGNFDSWDYGTWQFMTEEEYAAYVRTIDETATAAPTASDGPVKVVLNRSLIAKSDADSNNAWNTICLPFALTSEQIAQHFGEGTVVKELTGAHRTGDDALLTFTAVETIAANTPYIMQVDEARSTFQMRRITIAPTTNPAVTVDGIDFVGNYVKDRILSNEGGEDFYILNDEFKHSTGSTKIKGLRAFFHVPASSGIKTLGFDEGEATGIVGVENGGLNPADWTDTPVYDLSGRRVARPAKGLYIVNGKKVWIK